MAAVPVQDSIEYLLGLDFHLQHHDAMQDVVEILQASQNCLIHWHGGTTGLPMSVYPVPVVYDSVAQRDKQFDLYLERNLAIQGKFSPAAWDEEKAAYGITSNAVVQTNQRNFIIYFACMQNPVFSHSWHKNLWGDISQATRDKHYQKESEWHEAVLLIKNRKVCLSPFPLYTSSDLCSGRPTSMTPPTTLLSGLPRVSADSGTSLLLAVRPTRS